MMSAVFDNKLLCFAAVADAIRTSLGPRGMDKMVSNKSCVVYCFPE